MERLSRKLEVPIREFFDFPEDEGTSARRRALLATLADLARSMGEAALERRRRGCEPCR